MTTDARLRENDDRGTERVTYTGLTGDRRQRWRQVGWLGQTGAVYNLDHAPYGVEPGSFSPLWVLLDDEPAPVHEEAS